jgi:hypothetical protein
MVPRQKTHPAHRITPIRRMHSVPPWHLCLVAAALMLVGLPTSQPPGT